MIKRGAIGVAVATLLMSGAAATAQESATLVLRSGERISGQLVDLGGVGFTVRVNGQERQIRQNDVAVIEFGGGDQGGADAAFARLETGQQMVWLRNGTSVQGRLHDIAGKSPLKIIVDTPSGQREFTSNDVGRIYLASPNSGVSPTTGRQSASGDEANITVRANQQWTTTGVIVRQGEMIKFNSSGQVRIDATGAANIGPSGVSERRTGNAPMPSVFTGALIARVGENGQPFHIGNQDSVRMPASGPLFIGINDDYVGDNSGQFTVSLDRQSRQRRR